MNNLRNELSFTQEEMAILLGVSRTLITLYEKGMRNLPAKALEKLSRIQILINEASNKKPAPCRKLLALQQKHRQQAQNLLHAHAKKAATQAIRLSMQIAVIRQHYQQLENKAKLFHLLLQNVEKESREWHLLSNMQEQLLHNLDTGSPTSQYIVAYQLSLLITKQQVAMELYRTLQKRGKE